MASEQVKACRHSLIKEIRLREAEVHAACNLTTLHRKTHSLTAAKEVAFRNRDFTNEALIG
jgi:hypothetical protein